jgi:hypothetical protein
VKILLVEDELAQNIPRILQIFGECLTPNTRQKLHNMEESPQGATNEEIQLTLQRTPLDVEYSFPSALDVLRNLIAGNIDYDLLVIDRQLTSEIQEYTLEEIQDIAPEFTETDLHDYYLTEGDYLLQYLVNHHRDWPNLRPRVLFLTAHKDVPDNRWLIPRENLLEKGHDDHENELLDRVRKCEGVVFWTNHAQYLIGIEKLLGCNPNVMHPLKKSLLTIEDPKAGRLRRGEMVATSRSIFLEILNSLVSMAYGKSARASTVAEKIRMLSESDGQNTPTFSEIDRSCALSFWNIASGLMHSDTCPEPFCDYPREITNVVGGCFKSLLLRLTWLENQGLLATGSRHTNAATDN